MQITNSVGNPRMRWLDIDEGHHTISHEPDSNEEAYEQLVKINTWYSEQVAYMAQKLKDTPEPGGDGNMLDHTTIIWTNELGKGNSHTRNSIPFVMVGGGLGYKTGRSLNFGGQPHNRLLLSIAEAMGAPETFGNPTRRRPANRPAEGKRRSDKLEHIPTASAMQDAGLPASLLTDPP